MSRLAPPHAVTPGPSSIARSGSIEVEPFGRLGELEVSRYTLRSAGGLVMKAVTYGAIVTELHVPDRTGSPADVVLGFESLDGYLAKSPYFGATVGRVGNRIRDARFTLRAEQYELLANDGPNHLHGGARGWDKVVWDAEAFETAEGPAVRFRYVSPDGEEGYPGRVSAEAVYTLTHSGEFRIVMSAVTDRTTLVNMLHHSYWNLGGFASGPVTEHELTLSASRYTPGDPVVPTGAIEPVKGTPFDFTSPKRIGHDLRAVGGTPVGYDHNFVVDGLPGELRFVARLTHPASGRVMTLEADQPGVQFYSGNYLDGSIRGKGAIYEQYGGLCLETQKFPNSIGVPAWAKDVILEPGEVYRHTMIHRFTAA